MSSDVSIRGGWGAIGIELIFADDLQHAGYLRFRTASRMALKAGSRLGRGMPCITLVAGTAKPVWEPSHGEICIPHWTEHPCVERFANRYAISEGICYF